MKIKKTFFVFALFILILPYFILSYTAPFTTTHTLAHDYSWITFLEDSDHQPMLVKQIKDPDPTQQYELVLDALGATIAQSVGVNCNSIILAAPYSTIPGQPEPSLPSSLHSIVPGIPLSRLPAFKGIDFQQQWWPKDSPRSKKKPLTKETKGLRKSIIKAMAVDMQLSCIIAVDTFLSNTDGHNEHIYHDKQTNLFWKIDYGELYRCNLPEKALIQLASFIDWDVLSVQEKEALKNYKNTLQKLIEQWDTAAIIKLFDDFMNQAGFFEYPHLSCPQLSHKITRLKKQIHENYQSTKKLIKFIEFVLSNASIEK